MNARPTITAAFGFVALLSLEAQIALAGARRQVGITAAPR
jgi:hypothetical protein